MKLAIVILAHDRPQQLALLLSALRHPRVCLYLHVDRRSELAPITTVLADAGVREVELLPRHATAWGSVELVDAALEGLVQGAKDGCDYFALISGQDFPLQPIDEILAFFEKAAPRSYLEYFPLPDPRWRFAGRDRTDFYTYTVLGRRETCIPRGEDTSFFNWKGRALNEMLRVRTALKESRHFPSYVNPYGGSQWWNLSRAAVDHILDFLGAHPDYRRYHAHTLAPDEMFFQSILCGADSAKENEIINNTLRFMCWPEKESHPRILSVDDLPAMLESQSLFGRKFDAAVDEDVLTRLTELVTT
jgi:hypothetical protein